MALTREGPTVPYAKDLKDIMRTIRIDALVIQEILSMNVMNVRKPPGMTGIATIDAFTQNATHST